MKKNLNKIPREVIKTIRELPDQYFKVGVKIEITDKNIEQFKNFGLRWQDKKLVCMVKVLPLSNNGRYSRYNRNGRSVRRKDLPKVDKTFWGECYPYGNKNCSKVSYCYTKKVWQVEEWLPQFIEIAVNIEKEKDAFFAIFEVNNIIDKHRDDFEDDLLFAINLMQENVGRFEVYPEQVGPDEIRKWEYVDWEFLPPGKIDYAFIKRFFGKKTKQHQKEIQDRYNYLESLSPERMVRGTNYFSKYFGAKFENGTVVLENTESGNAIYVFHRNWQEFSKLSRSDLRRMKSLEVARIVHSGNWKKKLEHEIHKS